MTESTTCKDLIIDKCPLGCTYCHEIYLNEQTGHRIVCKCKCNHKQAPNYPAVKRSLET